MALRVLLADESQTIKKVIQLALQDFSVEVKPVHSGVDVLPIAKAFQPDLIFVDVLLAKRSGYDVCKDLKMDPATKNIPTVLMWNSLMGIDENRAKESLVNRRLEKPFEVETLRQIVLELAPKTISNPISSFLNFNEIESIRKDKIPAPPPVSPLPSKDSSSPTPTAFSTLARPSIPENKISLSFPEDFNHEDLQLHDDGEEFAQVPLHNSGNKLTDEPSGLDLELASLEPTEPEEDWQQQKISPIPASTLPAELPKIAPPITRPTAEMSSPEISSSATSLPTTPSTITPIDLPIESLDLKIAKVNVSENFEEIIFTSDEEIKIASPPPLKNKVEKPIEKFFPEKSILSQEAQEQIFRDEAKLIIEKICWNILPEIAERVIREEIKKLLQETEKSV